MSSLFWGRQVGPWAQAHPHGSGVLWQRYRALRSRPPGGWRLRDPQSPQLASSGLTLAPVFPRLSLRTGAPRRSDAGRARAPRKPGRRGVHPWRHPLSLPDPDAEAADAPAAQRPCAPSRSVVGLGIGRRRGKGAQRVPGSSAPPRGPARFRRCPNRARPGARPPPGSRLHARQKRRAGRAGAEPGGACRADWGCWCARWVTPLPACAHPSWARSGTCLELAGLSGERLLSRSGTWAPRAPLTWPGGSVKGVHWSTRFFFLSFLLKKLHRAERARSEHRPQAAPAPLAPWTSTRSCSGPPAPLHGFPTLRATSVLHSQGAGALHKEPQHKADHLCLPHFRAGLTCSLPRPGRGGWSPSG